MTDTAPVLASGTFDIGGDLDGRTGSATARCSSPARASGASPTTTTAPSRVLRRAVELGVNFIDTADSYGPFVSEDLIREALHPYADDVVDRDQGRPDPPGPGRLDAGRPPGVPAPAGELSLRRLGVETDRPLPAAPHRPAASRSRTSSASSPTLQRRGQDPPHRPVRGDASTSSRRRRRSRRSSPCRTSTTSPTGSAEALLDHCDRATASASSRGSRSRPASSPAPDGPLARCRRAPGATPVAARARLAAAPLAGRCCRSRARRASRTSRRTCRGRVVELDDATYAELGALATL